MKRLMVVLFCLFALSAFAGGKGGVEGFVKDAKTGEPVFDVLIHIFWGGYTRTDSVGFYRLDKVRVGEQKVTASKKGYYSTAGQVHVLEDSTVCYDILMGKVVQIPRCDSVTVTAEKIHIMKDCCTSVAPVKAVSVPSLQAGFVPYSEFNTEEYSRIEESGFFDAIQNPQSTFAADVDAASYSNVRRMIMNNRMPVKDAVRVEELINYFQYDYREPEGDNPLSINLEYGMCPWEMSHQLVHIGLKGKSVERQDQKPSNLVFLLDVSGSMEDPNKLPLLKKSFKLLVNQLTDKDRVAIVTYAGRAGLVLPSTKGSKKQTIMEAVERLRAGGSTAGGEGIQLAYKVAKENFIKGGNNRIILATDGDFNVGISNTSDLVRFVEEKRKDGIFITVLGFGMGNYKDDRLQEVADRGNGNHAYIDDILEAKKVLVSEISATLYTIAKDVKIQVEFNPAKVKSYRLVGYENRRLENKDFEDDKKDAGEIGSGHTVTALYEIVPEDSLNLNTSSDLKYQTTTIKDDALKSDEVLTVRIRYKEPDGDTSKLFSQALTGEPAVIDSTSDNFRFSAAVAEYGMILRDSEFKGNASLKSVTKLAKNALGNDAFGYRHEFLKLVERTELIMEND